MSTDWLALAAYGLLVVTYWNSSIPSHRATSALIGYLLLVTSKQMEMQRVYTKAAKLLKQVGYCFLLLTPSYTHLYDIFAILGYGTAFLGAGAHISNPNIALYNVLGLPAAGGLYFVARMLIAMSMALGYDLHKLFVVEW